MFKKSIKRLAKFFKVKITRIEYSELKIQEMVWGIFLSASNCKKLSFEDYIDAVEYIETIAEQNGHIIYKNEV